MSKYNSKKVADLDKVVQICGAIGDNYKPSNEALMPTAITSLLVVTNEKVKAVISAHEKAILLVKQRAVAFRGIPGMAARLVQMVASSETTVAEQVRAREIQRRYFGRSVTKVAKATPSQNTESTELLSSPSANFRDFAGQLAGFGLLIQLASVSDGYKSTEPTLQPEALKKMLADLQAIHDAANKAKLDLVNARDARNEIVESKVTGTLKVFKGYMRAKFGFHASMLKQF